MKYFAVVVVRKQYFHLLDLFAKPVNIMKVEGG